LGREERLPRLCGDLKEEPERTELIVDGTATAIGGGSAPKLE